VVRGEIFRLRLPRGGMGAEQRGARYAVVVQADELLALSTVLVSPTSVSAPPRSFRPAIEIDGTSTRVLVEQTTAISRNGSANRSADSPSANSANSTPRSPLFLGCDRP